MHMLLDTLEESHHLDKVGLMRLMTWDKASLIYAAADRVRKKYLGDEVHLRGLIEFSSYCHNTCLYCGLRAANNRIMRFRMNTREITEWARRAVALGLKTIVLQSGEDKAYSIDDLCRVVSGIKGMDVAVTLSIGELTKEEYARLKRAGADRYLLRIETGNRKLYEGLHPGMSYKNRLRCLYDLKELGYEVGTGCLIGLPGQTLDMLVEDLLFFKEFDIDMLGMGPFIPCPSTPLENEKGGDVSMVLKMMALARLLMPDINMPATTALGTRDSDGYRKGLMAGANVIMPNMGRPDYKRLYNIYPRKAGSMDDGLARLESAKKIVIEADRKIGQGYGNRSQALKKV